ncbi:MAG: hypothetical protein HOC71_13765 [Candidatus Latescibacteria bacterium]|nr:hypothetical protein [Candidatus Latescibacterota bacterium]
MTNKRIIAFIVFYACIILLIFFTHFYVQERYGHNPPKQKSETNSVIYISS